MEVGFPIGNIKRVLDQVRADIAANTRPDGTIDCTKMQQVHAEVVASVASHACTATHVNVLLDIAERELQDADRQWVLAHQNPIDALLRIFMYRSDGVLQTSELLSATQLLSKAYPEFGAAIRSLMFKVGFDIEG